MLCRIIISCVAAWVLAGMPAAGSSDTLRRARIITGYAPGESPAWDPLNDVDQLYLGPVRSGPGRWFLAQKEEPREVNTLEDLQRLIYDMAYHLKKRRKLDIGCGVLPRDIRQWLRRLNTSIYGQFTLEVRTGDYYLNAEYNPESRILAAFRNPMMEKQLEDNEKEALEVCAWWISENISRDMPNALKVKKIHDALIDTSIYMQGKHNPVDLLLKGEGSCVAYAAATQLLLHMVKIDCRRVCGTKSMNHVWNLVELNDEWYHLDVTWDDPVSSDPLRMYNYFLLTDAEADADHDWENAGLYTSTPQINPWHHSMRNFMRRSWVVGRSGYTLPREEEVIPSHLYNMYVKQTGGRLEEIASTLGLDVRRELKAEDKFQLDPDKTYKDYEHQIKSQKLARDKKFTPEDVPMRWSKYAPRVSRKRREPGSAKDVTSELEFNAALAKFHETLEGPRLVVHCKDSVEGWRMREIVGLSDINLYAESYNAIFNEVEHTITLDIVYLPEARYLAGMRGKVPAHKFSKRDADVLLFCKKWSAKLLDARSDRANADYLQGHLICSGGCSSCTGCRSKGPIRGYSANSVSTVLDEFPKRDRGYVANPGIAQLMHVIFTEADIPSKIVYGRDAHGQQAWTIVRVNPREWYHFDAYSEALSSCCVNHEKKGKQREAVDEVMREDHVWDVEEIPRTPTKAEQDARNQAGI